MINDGATDEEMVCVTGSGLRGGRVGDRGESGMVQLRAVGAAVGRADAPTPLPLQL